VETAGPQKTGRVEGGIGRARREDWGGRVGWRCRDGRRHEEEVTEGREDGIRGMDHSVIPCNSRDAVQHTYKTRGSSSLAVQENKSDIK
jgi:hypothetical protein